MFEKTIETVKKSLLGQMEFENGYVYLRDILSNQVIGEPYKRYIMAEVKWWIYLNNIERKNQKRFDYDDEKFQNVLKTMDDMSFKTARFSKASLNRVVDEAVKARANMVCRPRMTLKWFIYRFEKTKPFNEIRKRLDYFDDYRYLCKNVLKSIEDNIAETPDEIISVRDFKKIVNEADNDKIYSLSPEEFSTLLNPVYSFFNHTDAVTEYMEIPIEAIIIFLDDKDLYPLSKKLETLYQNNQVRLITKKYLLDFIYNELELREIENKEVEFLKSFEKEDVITERREEMEEDEISTEPGNIPESETADLESVTIEEPEDINEADLQSDTIEEPEDNTEPDFEDLQADIDEQVAEEITGDDVIDSVEDVVETPPQGELETGHDLPIRPDFVDITDDVSDTSLFEKAPEPDNVSEFLENLEVENVVEGDTIPESIDETAEDTIPEPEIDPQNIEIETDEPLEKEVSESDDYLENLDFDMLQNADKDEKADDIDAPPDEKIEIPETDENIAEEVEDSGIINNEEDIDFHELADDIDETLNNETDDKPSVNNFDDENMELASIAEETGQMKEVEDEAVDSEDRTVEDIQEPAREAESIDDNKMTEDLIEPGELEANEENTGPGEATNEENDTLSEDIDNLVSISEEIDVNKEPSSPEKEDEISEDNLDDILKSLEGGLELDSGDEITPDDENKIKEYVGKAENVINSLKGLNPERKQNVMNALSDVLETVKSYATIEETEETENTETDPLEALLNDEATPETPASETEIQEEADPNDYDINPKGDMVLMDEKLSKDILEAEFVEKEGKEESGIENISDIIDNEQKEKFLLELFFLDTENYEKKLKSIEQCESLNEADGLVNKYFEKNDIIMESSAAKEFREVIEKYFDLKNK